MLAPPVVGAPSSGKSWIRHCKRRQRYKIDLHVVKIGAVTDCMITRYVTVANVRGWYYLQSNVCVQIQPKGWPFKHELPRKHQEYFM